MRCSSPPADLVGVQAREGAEVEAEVLLEPALDGCPRVGREQLAVVLEGERRVHGLGALGRDEHQAARHDARPGPGARLAAVHCRRRGRAPAGSRRAGKVRMGSSPAIARRRTDLPTPVWPMMTEELPCGGAKSQSRTRGRLAEGDGEALERERRLACASFMRRCPSRSSSMRRKASADRHQEQRRAARTAGACRPSNRASRLAAISAPGLAWAGVP